MRQDTGFMIRFAGYWTMAIITFVIVAAGINVGFGKLVMEGSIALVTLIGLPLGFMLGGKVTERVKEINAGVAKADAAPAAVSS